MFHLNRKPFPIFFSQVFNSIIRSISYYFIFLVLFGWPIIYKHVYDVCHHLFFRRIFRIGSKTRFGIHSAIAIDFSLSYCFFCVLYYILFDFTPGHFFTVLQLYSVLWNFLVQSALVQNSCAFVSQRLCVELSDINRRSLIIRADVNQHILIFIWSFLKFNLISENQNTIHVCEYQKILHLD